MLRGDHPDNWAFWLGFLDAVLEVPQLAADQSDVCHALPAACLCVLQASLQLHNAKDHNHDSALVQGSGATADNVAAAIELAGELHGVNPRLRGPCLVSIEAPCHECIGLP